MFSLTWSRKIFFLAGILFLSSGWAGAQSFIVDGTVVDVVDGETITVRNRKNINHTVRLAGIDAPLLSQPHGEQAHRYLSGLLLGKTVKARGQRFDDTGILRGKVLLNGRDINLELIVAGLAWHRTEIAGEQSERDRQLYESAEFHARRSKFNLWADSKPAEAAKAESATKPASRPEPATEQPIRQTPPTIPLRTLANTPPPAGALKIIGNANSKIYHWPGCPGYTKVSEANQVPFKSTAEAEAAGYRAARNCSSPKP